MDEQYIVLNCLDNQKKLVIPLNDSIPSLSSDNLAKSNLVYENGKYDIYIHSSFKEDISEITAFVNGTKIGKANETTKTDNDISFKISLSDEFHNQPFLLLYDLVIISFEIKDVKGDRYNLYSSILLCVSKSIEDVNNIEQMLKELNSFDDIEVGAWMFSSTSKEKKISLQQGSWEKKTYKSLSSYIQLLESIVSFFYTNYPYFKQQAKHKLIKKNSLISYEKIKTITQDNFTWLMQNSEQLKLSPTSKGISYMGQKYVPLKMQSSINEKSYDIYENRIIVGFLEAVSFNAASVYSNFNKNIINEKYILEQIQCKLKDNYKAPIITVKNLQISYYSSLMIKLQNINNLLKKLLLQYSNLFNIKNVKMRTIPKKTKIFQEIAPYSKAFDIILRWFNYGEFSLSKDGLILKVKSLDKLFEYYCLYKLLNLFASKNYVAANVDNPIYSYTYTYNNKPINNETDIANTYILQKNNTTVTLYYQPIILSDGFENNINLYRITGNNYYTPDFILKFQKNNQEEYLILDSKFSSRSIIKEYHLNEIVKKYCVDTAVNNIIPFPKMVWALQGRVENTIKTIWKKTLSENAKKYGFRTTYGIISINTKVNTDESLWKEITEALSFNI